MTKVKSRSRSLEFTTDSSYLVTTYHMIYHIISYHNILRPRQNGRLFPAVIFKRVFMNENVWISIKISLKFVPNGSINNIPALVQIWLGAHRRQAII